MVTRDEQWLLPWLGWRPVPCAWCCSYCAAAAGLLVPCRVCLGRLHCLSLHQWMRVSVRYSLRPADHTDGRWDRAGEATTRPHTQGTHEPCRTLALQHSNGWSKAFMCVLRVCVCVCVLTCAHATVHLSAGMTVRGLSTALELSSVGRWYKRTCDTHTRTHKMIQASSPARTDAALCYNLLSTPSPLPPPPVVFLSHPLRSYCGHVRG